MVKNTKNSLYGERCLGNMIFFKKTNPFGFTIKQIQYEFH